MPPSLLMEELTSPEVSRLISEGWRTVIVPLGATEQHGPALPLLVDNEHGLQTALRAARKLGKTLVGPVVTLGHSPEHASFAGTISLSPATVAAMIGEIAASHARSGFNLIYFWVAHGGNFAVLKSLLPGLHGKWPGCRVAGLEDLTAYLKATWDLAPKKEGVASAVSGSHAGEFETSMMLAARPDLVRMDRAEAGDPRPLEDVVDLMFKSGIQAVSANGVLGDQRAGNAQRGDRYLDVLADFLAGDVQRHRATVK